MKKIYYVLSSVILLLVVFAVYQSRSSCVYKYEIFEGRLFYMENDGWFVVNGKKDVPVVVECKKTNEREYLLWSSLQSYISVSTPLGEKFDAGVRGEMFVRGELSECFHKEHDPLDGDSQKKYLIMDKWYLKAPFYERRLDKNTKEVDVQRQSLKKSDFQQPLLELHKLKLSQIDWDSHVK